MKRARAYSYAEAVGDALAEVRTGPAKPARKAVSGPRRLLSDVEAAAYLGVSRSYIRAQVANGRIPRVELPSVDGERRARVWRVDVSDLDAWIAKLKGE